MFCAIPWRETHLNIICFIRVLKSNYMVLLSKTFLSHHHRFIGFLIFCLIIANCKFCFASWYVMVDAKNSFPIILHNLYLIIIVLIGLFGQNKFIFIPMYAPTCLSQRISIDIALWIEENYYCLLSKFDTTFFSTLP